MQDNNLFIATCPRMDCWVPGGQSPLFVLYLCMFLTGSDFLCCFSLCLQVRGESRSPDQSHQIIQPMP